MRLAFIGVAIGLAAALAMTRVIQNLLFKLSATDPLTFVVIPALLLLLCWLVSFRRGARRRSIRWSRFELTEFHGYADL